MTPPGILKLLTATVQSGNTHPLPLDANGNPHISYYDVTNGDLKYAFFDTAWHIETVDTNGDAGKFTSLALDADSKPHISYYDVPTAI